MKFIASIFIILAFTPQSEAGELWDFARATTCPSYTDYMLCIKANKKDYYSGKCDKILTMSLAAEGEKFSLLIEDKNNKEDLKKLSNASGYGREAVCPVPSFSDVLPDGDERLRRDYDRQLKRGYDRWLDCLVEDFYPTFLEKLQCKELLKNSEKEL